MYIYSPYIHRYIYENIRCMTYYVCILKEYVYMYMYLHNMLIYIFIYYICILTYYT